MADHIGALNSLLRSTGIEDHDEALHLADAAIKAAKPSSDELLTAHHTKVVALLKLDRFDDALRAIAAAGNRLEDHATLEKGYALYKTGQLEDAQAVLKKAAQGSEPPRGIKHVAAQVAYRAEKFDRAAEIYRDLVAHGDEAGIVGEEFDLNINLLATNAQLEWQGNGHLVPQGQKQPAREDMEAFETAYNAACGCLARGDLSKAAVLLKRSRDLCEASEDLSEEERKAELVPIIVQQAYVSTKLGKLEEAAALQTAAGLDEISDAATQAVAQNNALVVKPEGNPYIAQKLIRAVPKIAGNDRLFKYQSSVLRRNKYILELQAHKFAGVEKTTGHIIDSDESQTAVSPEKASLGVLQAAAVAQLRAGKEALAKLLPSLDKRPHDVGLLLTVLRLYLQLQNPEQAVVLLEAFFARLETVTTQDKAADVRFAPGLVALAVSLYKLQGRGNAVRAELARAAAHWERSSTSTANTDGQGTSSADSLLRSAGIALLHSSIPSDLSIAGAAFERLTAATPSDRLSQAGYVASFATVDPAKSTAHLDLLTPVDKLVSGVDVSSLLTAGVASLPQPPSSSRKRGAAEAQPKTTVKRRRPNKPSKEALADPSRKPDPERWLPLRDRSSYKPKKGKKKRAADLTQGGVAKEEAAGEVLELAGGAGSVKVEKASGGKKGKGKGKKK